MGGLIRKGMPAAVGAGAFLAACALPGIGLLDQADIATSYLGQIDAIGAGAVPYRDFAFEYPPAALVSFAIPALAPAEHREAAFLALHIVFGVVVIVALDRTLVA